MYILLADSPQQRLAFAPFSFTRPLGNLRLGILTILEKWQHTFSSVSKISPTYGYLTTPQLTSCFSPSLPTKGDYLIINGTLLPTPHLTKNFLELQTGEVLRGSDNHFLACRVDSLPSYPLEEPLTAINYSASYQYIQDKFELLTYNTTQITKDLHLIQKEALSTSSVKDPYTAYYSPENIFIESDVSIKKACLDASKGPIYIGKGSIIRPGSVIEGPVSIGQNVQIFPQSIINNATIGPFSKVGGEVIESIVWGYSNKAHYGFLGHSIIGAWCNIGAGTTTSNLRNTYTPPKIFNYTTQTFETTRSLFCGLFMGDHSKCGINTAFLPGTTIDPFASIALFNYPPRYLSPFSWCQEGQPLQHYQLEKALNVATLTMQRRNILLTQAEKDLFTYLFPV